MLKIVIRVFEVLSYVFTTLGWLWFGVVLFPLAQGSGAFTFLLPTTPQPQPAVVHHEANSPFLLVLAAFVTALMIIISLIALWRLPRNLAKLGNAASHSVSDAVIPLITHHKKIPKKTKRKLNARIVLYARIAFILIPLAGTLACPPIKELSREIVVVVSAGTACIAAVCLLVEKLLEHYTVPVRTTK